MQPSEAPPVCTHAACVQMRDVELPAIRDAILVLESYKYDVDALWATYDDEAAPYGECLTLCGDAAFVPDELEVD
jgi:hypothetical protein